MSASARVGNPHDPIEVEYLVRVRAGASVTMDANKTAIERAFELAKSGRLASINEVRRALKSEGYFTHHLTGPSLLAQIRKLIQDARES